MKHLAVRMLAIISVLVMTHLVSTAQVPFPITQNPTYPCDVTTDSGSGTIQCLHVCAGDTVKYNTNLDGGMIKWDIFGNGTILAGQGTQEITVVWNGPGQYVILLTVCQSPTGGGCETFHLCITVEPGVMAAIGYDPGYTISGGCIKICNQTSVTLNSTGSVSNIVSCDWDFGDGFTTTTTGSVVTHTYNTPGNYTVILTAHSACCSDTAKICVLVDSLTGPDIFCISPVCGGTMNAQYCTSASCTNYNWSVTGGTISGATNANCVTVNWGAGPAGTVSLFTTNCTPATCPVASVATVPIMPNGPFIIGGPIVACLNSTNTYSAPYIPGAQYTWTLTDPSAVTTTLPYSSPPYLQNITFTQLGTYVLKCHMTNDVLECTGDGILTIQVLDDFTIAGNDTVCAGGTGNFSATQNFNPFNVDWTTSPSVGTVLNSSTASFTFNTVGTYTVIATPLPGTACSPTKTLTVVVIPAPAQPTISPNPLVCPGTPYTYTASGSGPGVTYNWTATNGITFNSPVGGTVTATIPNGFTTGTITVTPVTSSGCPGPAATITVNAYATPTPLITIGDPSVCPDETPTYTATLSYSPTSTVNWTLSPSTLGTIQSGQGTGSVVIEWHASIPNVTQTCVVTVTETICGNLSGSATYTVTINPTPSPVAPDANICIGGTATLTVTGGGGSTFNWFNSANGNNVGMGSSITVNSPGNYYVEETDANGCKAKDYLLVTAYPQPTAGISASAPANCDTLGNLSPNIQLQTFGGAGYTFSWSGPGIVGSTTSNPITISTVGGYSVLVTEPVHGCTSLAFYSVICATSDTCQLPSCTCSVGTPTATQNGPYCDNYTFNTNSGCPIITWSFGDGQYGSGASVIHQYTAPGVYFVFYSAGDVGCCPNGSQILTITVPAVANFTPSVNCNTVCFTDASASLPSDPLDPSGYSWDFGDFSTSNSINPCHTYALAGTYSVTLEVTTVNGCKAKIIKSVTVNGPNVSATIASSACNLPVNFAGSTSSTNITNWSWNFGDAQGSNMQNAQHTYTVGVTTTFTVTVTVTDANGCMATATGSITVSPPPPPFNLIYTSPGCGNVLLNAGGGYTSYQWFMNGTSISGATNQTYSATTSGNYYAEVIDGNGCLIQSNQASIIVNPLPALNLTASPQPLCSNQAITLNSGLSGNYFVEWKDAGFNPLGTGLTYAAGILPAGSYTFNVVATDLSTFCKAVGSITITVNPAPSVTISNSNPSGICAPNPVTLTATGSPAAVTYSWSTGATSPVINVFSGGIYTVTVTDPANGCMASAFNNVIIFPLPDLSLLPIGCDSACDNPVTDTIHGPPGMTSYDWQINGNTVATTQNLGLNPLNLPNFGVPYTITLIATTADGCTDSTKFQYTPQDCDSSSVACYSIKDTTWCNTDGTYSFQLMVQNNHGTASASILLDNFTIPFVVNGLTYYYQFLNIPSGGNSGWFPATPLILANPTNDPTPASFCFHTNIVFGDTCCIDSLCITIPNCNPCDNISASAASDSGSCCQSISITNNFNGNFFTGVQVVPITPGATIASTTLGPGGIGWGASGNQLMMSFYPPGNSTIPLGTINDLVTVCLNLLIGTPNPQYVLINWFVPNAQETDSIVCTDTLVFHCDPPLANPCGTVDDTIECHGDGTYAYTFTVNNNSANPIQTAVIDYLSPMGGVNMPIIFFFNPAIPSGGSATQTTLITSALPAGSIICYHMTLLDSIGCCCHAMDTVCFELPPCDSTCGCGSWDLFTIHLDPTDVTVPSTIENVECGATMPNVIAGSSVSFLAGGYSCSGDSGCTSLLTWVVPGGTPSSGTGLPSFTFNNPGSYTLTVYGSCGGHLCDSCQIHFVVDAPCACGNWNLFSLTIQQPPPNLPVDYPTVECGANYSNLIAGTSVNFTGGGYTCNGNAACSSLLTWSLPGATPSSGTGLPSFTLNSVGSFTLTLYGYCGGNICDSCKITFGTVEACSCGTWQPFNITTSETSFTNQPCGKIYNSRKGFPIIVNGSFSCTGGAGCSATYSWTVYKNNIFYLSGTSLPVNFTPSAVGTYSVVLSAQCGGHDCETCTFTFNVKSPVNMANYQDQQLAAPASPGMLSLSATPNPARDIVNLKFDSGEDVEGMVTWYNDLGVAVKQLQVLLTTKSHVVEVHVSELPAGVYFVRFNGDHATAFTTVIVYR